jgi:hypothetical protein
MRQQITTWDTGTWDSGNWDSPVTPERKKHMIAKVALNLYGLDNRGKLAKFQTAITKCGEVPPLANPIPLLTDCQAAHDAAEAQLDLIDTKEAELKNLRLVRDQLLDTAVSKYTTLGACVENRSLGDPAFILAKGYDVAGSPTPVPPVGRVTNLSLKHGDHDGAVDASWDRDYSAYSYEVQTSHDPMTPGGWVPNQTSPRSTCTLSGLPSATRVWVRVRAIGGDVPGEYSDPAPIVVS